MCYVHLTDAQTKKIGAEHTAAEWINLGRQLLNNGTLLLLLTGGEVFVRPDFREIYEAFSEMGFILHIYSNGYLLDEEKIEWLSKRPPMNLRITLYGASNETYERVTGVKNAFDRVMRNIGRLISAQIPLSLAATIISENESDLEAIQKIADDRKLQFIYTDNVLKPVRGASSEAEKLRVGRFEEADDGAEVTRVERMFEVKEGAFERCASENCGFWVTWDGRMTICSFIENPCTYPFEQGFKTAWSQLQEKLGTIKKPAECKDCKYNGFCFSCPGIFASETGYPDRTCENICKRARKIYEKYSISYTEGNRGEKLKDLSDNTT
jgi:MoaA/NifB/PqqE/SkfB family radical SAM enzyme